MTSRRAAASVVIAATVLALAGPIAAPALAAGPTAVGAQVTDPERTAAVQSVLDRVLGPGASVVQVTDQVTTGAVSSTAVRFGGAHALQVGTSSVRDATGGRTATVQRNAVDRTATTTVTAGGTLLRERVAVTVDGSRLGTVSAKALRRTVAAAAGVSAARGDSVAVLVVPRFARSVVAAPARATPFTIAAAWLPVGGSAVAVLAALLVAGAVRRRSRSASSGFLRARPAPLPDAVGRR